MGAGAAPRPISVAIDQLLSLSRARGAWISMRRQRLQGMVGARRRGSNQAWEVDYLIDSSKARHAATDLLERAIVDAGLKAFSFDSGLPVVADGTAEYIKASDEHGVLKTPPGSGLKLGDKLRIVPGHCDPTVNLYDWIVGYRDGIVELIWPIAGRGAFY